MSKKLGEVLIEKGRLTSQQLDEALKAQLIYGGHLGTNLIELGLITEACLGETLEQMLGVRYATQKMLEDVSPSVIGTMTAKTVEKYRVVPIKLEDKVLHVATTDPQNLAKIDEIGFLTGYRICPWVAPEIRLYQAMERYYQIPRRARYITLCRDLDREPAPAVGAGTKRARPAPAAETANRGIAAMDSRPPAGVGLLDEPCRADPGAGEENDELYGYGRDWREIAARETGAPRAALRGASGATPSGGAAAAAGTPPTLEAVAARLARADDKQGLADAALDFVAPRAARVILFQVQGEMLRVWDTRGASIDRRSASDLSLPVTSGSIFELLLGNDSYRGRVPREEKYLRFFRQMGLPFPEEALLVPVHVNDRLVAVLYADGTAAAPLAGDVDEYEWLAQKLSLAISMVLLKVRIRSPRA